MDNKINSALALTKTKIYQQYHVFAYKLNPAVEPSGGDAIFGSIIILASFGNPGDEDEENIKKAKHDAEEYARSIYKMCGYPLIFYTKSHYWFNLTRRPTVDKVYYIDDKSGITFAKDFINKDMIEKLLKDDGKSKLDKEEQKMIRKRNNPDNVEHYVTAIQNVVRINGDIKELEKQIEERKKDLLFETDKMSRHYKNHPKHEKEAVTILRTRIPALEYNFMMMSYNEIKKEIFSEEPNSAERESFYVKKHSGNSSGGEFWSSSKGEGSNSERWARRNNSESVSETPIESMVDVPEVADVVDAVEVVDSVDAAEVV